MMLICAADAGRAQTNPVHIAVVPFSAPIGDHALQNAAALFPDLLTTTLSHDNRFSLVERDKISAVWSEFHLTEAGLDSAAAVVKLGQTLSCDWLVSGSLVQAGTNQEVWIKIIDTQSSVVLDLQSMPYNATNFTKTAAGIANFLAQARSRSTPREFVTLEEIQDKNISSTKEDLTPWLKALIESNLLANGFGVVEREDVSPIFSEYQLQSAGMTTDDTKRVKLKPVFWTVGGSWMWFPATPPKVVVTLKIRRMGGEVLTIGAANTPGEALDKYTVKALLAILKKGGSLTADQALAAEVKLRQANIHEEVEGRDTHIPSQRFLDNAPQTTFATTNTDGTKNVMIVSGDMVGQWESHHREMLNSLHQAILLNPKDMKSKFTLAQISYYDGPDSDEAKLGDKLLEEVIASGDRVFAKRAEYWRDDIHSGKISFKRTPWGSPTLVTRGDPASFQHTNTASPERMAALKADVEKLYGVTNVAVWAENKMSIPHDPIAVAYLNGGSISAYFVGRALGKGPLFIARGTNLETFDWTGSFDSGFQKYDLPVKLEHSITAINGDKSALWLGTDGGGLVKIPAGGGAPEIFGEKDGFPMAFIQSLAINQGKLLIGFGHGRNGAFGYLDLATSKFTGVMKLDATGTSAEEAFPPPPPRNAVYQIQSGDTNTWWIGSDPALYRLKWDSQKWTLELPRREQRELPQIAGLQRLAVNGDYAANILSPGGVGICKISENRWSHLNLSTNLGENYVSSIAIDPGNPKYLWVGDARKISIIDMSTQKIVGQHKLVMSGRIHFMIIYPEDVFLVADGNYFETYILYHWQKPQYP